MSRCIDIVMRDIAQTHSNVRSIEIVREEDKGEVKELIVEVRTADTSLFYKYTVRKEDCTIMNRELMYAIPLL